ncbi:two-component system sensor histidine kinase/res ponse regulator hybrid [Arcticibacter svalbardensis MN12-7]|uniref:histidine kinase n=1 Tax=Arcticibacter svalbardensis MN12-7 TaxID=1150600 RepID=R9GUF5_9SPHI|nr:response regulator [Arcticibacter svalbardensis]EOR92549.1 two-component system sensor histidine kinase/res ponse regulator hybrid [Arcticibacter svalbardensis MN12-7]
MIGKIHLFGILKDSHNQIWLISRGDGVVRIDLEKKKIYHYNEGGPLSIPSNRIVCIKESNKGDIWIGTRGEGLLKFRPSFNDFIVYNISSGLPSNTVCDIEESTSGEIWVSTLNGVSKYDDSQMLPFFSFGLDDGIFNPEFNFGVGCNGPNNQLFFSSGNGFYKVAYLPKSESSRVLPVVWTSFNILNKKDSSASNLLNDIIKTNKISLASSSSISIGFAALDYTNPENINYAYRLKGKDEEWSFIRGINAEVQYSDLSPGEYDFQVRGSNSRGEWLNTPSELHITVAANIWNTPFAWFLYVCVFIACGIGIFYLRRRWYKLNKDLEIEQEVTELHHKRMVQFADLSHEIKNRLTLILGPLEEALHGKKVNQIVLNNLYEQAQRLKRLSDQIIHIRKNESGGYMLNVSKENIKNHLQHIIEELKPLAILKNVELNFANQLNTDEGWYDKELVEIIVLNILGNAIKYSVVNGKVKFSVSVEQENSSSSPREILIIKITDNGVGIPKENIKKILDPFYRGDNVRNNKKEFEGDGIGLNLVSRLINIHHGQICIDSEPLVFTVVELKIPISQDEYANNELKVNIKNTPIILPDDDNIDQSIIHPNDSSILIDDKISGKIILIIDDDPQIRTLLNETLNKDFTVIEAGDGLEALKMLEKQQVDLVLSDLSMPNMDGLTLCIQLKKDKRWSFLPFLIMTARNSEEQRLVAFKSSVDDFIEKPFSLELIKWRVKAMLRQQKNLVQNVQKVVVATQLIDESDSADEIFIHKVVNKIDANIGSKFLTVDYLADEIGMSRATFYRKMEQLFGESPSNFIRKTRLKKSAVYIKSEKYTISEVAFKTGFKTPNYFSKCFFKEFGVPPSNYIK